MANIHGLRSGESSNKNPFARPPQAAHVVEPQIEYGQAKKVENEKQLDAALKSAGQKNQLSVLYFCTAWYPPCFKMGPFVGQLSQRHGGVQFLRVDCEALPALAEKYRVNALPYFVFVKKQSIEDRMEGNSEERVEMTIMRLTGGRIVTAEGHKLGSDPSPQQPQAPQQPDAGVQALEGMGFSAHQAKVALQAVGGSVEAAAAWILDHPEVPFDAPAEEQSEAHVHQALCDRCKKQVVGTRYKCNSCKDFDLCEGCYQQRMMWHDEEHEFQAHTSELQVEQKSALVLSPEEAK